jgi:hypothetical protein
VLAAGDLLEHYSAGTLGADATTSLLYSQHADRTRSTGPVRISRVGRYTASIATRDGAALFSMKIFTRTRETSRLQLPCQDQAHRRPERGLYLQHLNRPQPLRVWLESSGRSFCSQAPDDFIYGNAEACCSLAARGLFFVERARYHCFLSSLLGICVVSLTPYADVGAGITSHVAIRLWVLFVTPNGSNLASNTDCRSQLLLVTICACGGYPALVLCSCRVLAISVFPRSIHLCACRGTRARSWARRERCCLGLLSQVLRWFVCVVWLAARFFGWRE